MRRKKMKMKELKAKQILVGVNKETDIWLRGLASDAKISKTKVLNHILDHVKVSGVDIETKTEIVIGRTNE